MTSVSVLIPVYNNANTLSRLILSVEQLAHEFREHIALRILVVDDSSVDGSLQIALNHQLHNKDLSVLELANNHTQANAFYAALHYVESDYMIYLSADLQEESSLAKKFLQEVINHPEIDFFAGYRMQNEDFFIFRMLSSLFYSLIRLKLPRMPKGGFDTGCVKKCLMNTFVAEYKNGDMVQAILIKHAQKIKHVPYTRLRSSAKLLRFKSFIFKVRYFISSIRSVYFGNRNGAPVSFMVKKYYS
jgi:glycosyltransferase involved in cell wall biosynthesis